MQRKDKGPLGEQLALTHLLQAGLTLIERNYSCKLGEIDLVMTDRSALAEVLVFFEVRYRNSRQFGGAAASVDTTKQKKLIRTAQHFLKTHPKLRKLPARFDVIALSGKPAEPDLRWIKQAFQQ